MIHSLKLKSLSFLLFPLNIFSQNIAWQWQNPLPQGNNLVDIQHISPEAGFAAGDEGAFLKTTDAGMNWEMSDFHSLMDINDIHFINENLGWVTGIHDSLVFLFKTAEGGLNWEVTMEMEGDLTSVYFLNEDIGWFTVDSTIYRTNDGGLTWEFQNMSSQIVQIYFLDENIGWATGDGIGGITIYRTTDGGVLWQPVIINSSSNILLNGMSFVNTNVGWIIGYSWGPNHLSGELYKTIDGGENWEEQFQIGGGFPYVYFSDIEFYNEDMGWVISTHGIVYRTLNGGADWSEISSAPHLRQITLINESTLWGAGNYGVHYVSLDSGLTWIKQYEGTLAGNSWHNDLSIVNNDIAFAVSGTTLLKTTNGGINWDGFEIEFDYPVLSILSICFTDSLKGWIGTTYGGGWGGLFNTTDGGYTWTNQIDSVYRFFDIYFYDFNIGWAVGGGSQIYKTTDGGQNWTLQPVPEGYFSFNAIYFSSPDSGWAGGYAGLVTTTDGGENWTQIEFDYGFSIGDIHFTNYQEGWVVGNGGSNSYILKTSDGGETWESQQHPLPNNAFPRSVYFINANQGWVLVFANRSIVLYTSDGGNYWEEINFPTEQLLTQIKFTDENRGWILGGHGLILMTSSVETVSIENIDYHSLLNNFALYQPYPNPFNPTTTIRFKITETHTSLLQIYDITGRLVEELVNGKPEVGEHEIVWNAGNLPSGVYFVRLQSGEFFENQKVLLIK